MPFLKKIETAIGVIGVWKFAESGYELLQGIKLSESEKKTYNAFKIEKRKREFLSVRTLLKKLTDNEDKIEYEKSGRPILNKSDKKISISHSSELAVTFLSEKNVGIDVENTRRKIAPIAKRFLSRAEMDQTNNNHNKQLAQTIYWSAKEAIFKCTTEENIQFDKHIRILPFKLQENGDFRGLLETDNRKINYQLSYFTIENNVIVYCVEV